MSTAEDELAIRKVLTLYCRRADDQDFDAWSEVFAEDCVCELTRGTYNGRAEMAQHGKRRGPDLANGIHVILNSEIDIDGDTALAVSDAMFLNPVGGEVRIALMWRFHDDFVKRDGRWQIARRRFSRQRGTPLPSSSVPAAPGQAAS